MVQERVQRMLAVCVLVFFVAHDAEWWCQASTCGSCLSVRCSSRASTPRSFTARSRRS